MMVKNLWLWQLGGFTFSAVFGTILHFLFDWTGAYALTPISAVNESTWEHMKILFFPMLIFACIQSRYFRADFTGYWWIKLIGTSIGVVSIPVLFYTIGGAFGDTPDWINILIFFVSAAVAYICETRLFNSGKVPCKSSKLALGALGIIALLFVVFTFAAPKIGIFMDPITKAYGI